MDVVVGAVCARRKRLRKVQSFRNLHRSVSRKPLFWKVPRWKRSLTNPRGQRSPSPKRMLHTRCDAARDVKRSAEAGCIRARTSVQRKKCRIKVHRCKWLTSSRTLAISRLCCPANPFASIVTQMRSQKKTKQRLLYSPQNRWPLLRHPLKLWAGTAARCCRGKPFRAIDGMKKSRREGMELFLIQRMCNCAQPASIQTFVRIRSLSWKQIPL